MAPAGPSAWKSLPARRPGNALTGRTVKTYRGQAGRGDAGLEKAEEISQL